MSGDMIAILSVGIGLGVLSTGLFAWLRADMAKVEERLRADLVTFEKRLRGNTAEVEERLRADMVKSEERWRTDLVTVEKRVQANLVALEEHLRADIKQLADRVGRLEYGQAKLEGLLEGLREAVTGRATS